MKHRKLICRVCFTTAIMAALMFNANIAASGAAAGVDLCLKVIIPSLFPFFVVTTYLNHCLLGIKIPGIRSVARLLRIPDGGESLLLLGLIGGYPVGAQLIADAYRSGQLNKRTAQILLGYCSNAGPAFIFGITGSLFSSTWMSFGLWGIHILSALLTGFLLPRPCKETQYTPSTATITLPAAMERSIRICATVCGWIVLFKILLSYLNILLAPIASHHTMITISAVMELSNGCIQLSQMSSHTSRFILSSAFLSFGGLCVLLQTVSVTVELGLGLYTPGKLMQTSLSILLSIVFCAFFFHEFTIAWLPVSCACIVLIIYFHRYSEKRYGNPAENTV